MPGPSGLVDADGREINVQAYVVTILALGQGDAPGKEGITTHVATVRCKHIKDAFNTAASMFLRQFAEQSIPEPQIFHMSATRTE